MTKTTFEFEGHSFTVDYGLQCDGSRLDYSRAVEIMNPDKEWVHGVGGSYQGDWMSVGRSQDGRWWLVEGSYGSCSGCDWLEGISSEGSAIEFLKEMKKTALIGSSKAEALAYLAKTRTNAFYEKQEAIDAVSAQISKRWTS